MDSNTTHYLGVEKTVRRPWATNRPLAAVGVAMVGVLLVAAVGLVVDPRVITGAPAWLKPAKFAISIAIYSFTFLWLLTFIEGHPRLVRLASWVTAIAFALEMVLIAGAAALGTTSHFNVSTPIHGIVWSTMGSAIVATWVANLVVGVLLLRQRIADPVTFEPRSRTTSLRSADALAGPVTFEPRRAFAWSLRLGVLVSAVGMGVAFFMTSPTAAQLTAARSGQGLPISGAHTVGAVDGGPGLPVVGWSTVGGDLRAPHFFGLHALQLLPLLGIALTRFAPAWLRPGDRLALVITGGLSYLGFVALTTWQALRGQPLLSPDTTTLVTLAALLGTSAVAAATITLRARSTNVDVP